MTLSSLFPDVYAKTAQDAKTDDNHIKNDKDSKTDDKDIPYPDSNLRSNSDAGIISIKDNNDYHRLLHQHDVVVGGIWQENKHQKHAGNVRRCLDFLQSKQATTASDAIKEHIEVAENRMPTSKFLIETLPSEQSVTENSTSTCSGGGTKMQQSYSAIYDEDGGKSNGAADASSVAAISKDENYGDNGNDGPMYPTASSNDENGGYTSEDSDDSDGYLVF